MRRMKYLIIFLMIMIPLHGVAVKRTRILFLMDASSSMTASWNEQNNRFEVASKMVLSIMDSIYVQNNEVEFAVRAYGTKHPAQEKNCTDTRLEVPFNFQNVDQIRTRLKYIQPIGYSPIAYSLEQAALNELAASDKYDYSIIFITDGGESCGGDICATFSRFVQSKISVQPYVIGLAENNQLRSYYNCMGKYVDVLRPDDIPRAIQMIVDANRSILDKPKTLNLVTQPSKVEPIQEVVPKPLTLPKPTPNQLFSLAYRIFRIPEPAIKVIPVLWKPFSEKKPATLRFAWEAEPAKQVGSLATLTASLFSLTPTSKTPAKPNKQVLASNKKATLRFDWEEEVVRTDEVFTRMRMPVWNRKKMAGLNIEGKTKRPSLGKATLRFDFPLERTAAVFPALTPVYRMVTKRDSIKITAKKRTLKPAQATLRFTVLPPRDTVIVRALQPKYMSRQLKSLEWKSNAKNFTAKALGKATVRVDYEVPKKEVITRLLYRKYPKRTGYAMSLPNKLYTYDAARPTIRFTLEAPPKPVVKTTPKTINLPKPDEMTFSIKTENSTATTVQFYLVGDDGREYPKATPKIQVLDVISKDTLYTFIRAADMGSPKKEPIQPGTYDVIIKEYNVASAFNVKIEPNKTNKVTLKLKNGTLRFFYNNNFTRPVEYTAKVVKRFSDLPSTTIQKCTDILTYPPSQYYVEINTLPITKRSIFLDFFVEYSLPIPEPGTVQFTNTNPMGKIILQQTLGDGFASFLELKMSGKLNEQTLTLQPGLYRVVYPMDPKMPMAGNKNMEFRVETNKNTMVELK